jgi:signal transduction histidine kinase
VRVADPGTELGRLATILNTTFARLEAAFARQQRFTSDAAHELRTPLAIMISEAQVTLARPRNAKEYKGTVEDCLEIAHEMRSLTETLLDLARLDVDCGSTRRTQVDLAEVASHCIEKLRTIAAEQEVSVNRTLLPARVYSAPERIELVITNLLANAICYNHRGGRVFVTTHSDSEHVTFRIADTGIGIGPADLPHIFERFYRADKARSRAQGHTGLGLAICKSILDAEGGTIHVDSQCGNGAVFTVTLPTLRLR